MYEQLQAYGFSRFHLLHADENHLDPGQLARVVSASHENYRLISPRGEYLARPAGKLRFAASDGGELPVTGDWVTVSPESEELIIDILPRQSILARSMVGRHDDRVLGKQILAANLDSVVIVMAAGRDFNLSRLERYLTLTNNQDIIPVVFLNKTDLIDQDEVLRLESEIFRRHPEITLFSGSLLTGVGTEELCRSFSPGKSFCVVGSSGVGKSSLINYLAQSDLEKVSQTGKGTNRGRHTTTAGHLHILTNGAIMIDTPGLRKVGIIDAEEGLQQTFADIEEIATRCRFSDCTHTSEPGCAVLRAIAEGKILEEKFRNYAKLSREASRFSQTVAEKRKKEKSFGKMVKEILKIKRQLKN